MRTRLVNDILTILVILAAFSSQPLTLNPAYKGHQNELLYSGLLPGRYQTVFRAELYAVIVALAIFKKVHIHSDNSAVAKGINHIIQHGYQDAKWANHPDRDLFKTAANFLRRDGERQVKVEWVKAHRELSEATGTLDLWQIFHNSRADHWAGYCFKSSIPTEIAEARDTH